MALSRNFWPFLTVLTKRQKLSPSYKSKGFTKYLHDWNFLLFVGLCKTFMRKHFRKDLHFCKNRFINFIKGITVISWKQKLLLDSGKNFANTVIPGRFLRKKDMLGRLFRSFAKLEKATFASAIPYPFLCIREVPSLRREESQRFISSQN